MLIFDAHLDLAFNAVDWNRDLRMSITETGGNIHGLESLSSIAFLLARGVLLGWLSKG